MKLFRCFGKMNAPQLPFAACAMLVLFASRSTPSAFAKPAASQPAASVEDIIVHGNTRFTIISDRFIRIEWSSKGEFEDRPSFFALTRSERSSVLTMEPKDRVLTFATKLLKITHNNDGKPPHDGNLTIRAIVDRRGRPYTASPPFAHLESLGGTVRTLDGISGSIALEPGLFTRQGVSIIDDSKSLLFDTPIDGIPWFAARRDADAIDWYVFAHGHDYKESLAEFTELAGRIPMPPRYAFGAWWSRYWAYSADELVSLVGEFDAHDVPLDVLVIDMDWHLPGWTGYTWNPDYFPDPKGFLNWVREQGLRTTLNLHPADGVGKHEAAFEQLAKVMGVDPASTERIAFDCADPRFIDAYLRILHHPMERDGVDFWWMDWQQGTGSTVAGLDPLFWLNHVHWHDMLRRTDETGRRPLIFSRWGGLGNHRYQIGFSGDTFCNWPSLAFQPYFTATAANVGFGYWSHDIGGHQPGPVDPELYARWIQFGALSPILRTHTTKNPAAERRIWKFPEPVFNASRDAFRLRYALAPYIYTMARRAYDTGVALCRPLYYEWPTIDEAYARGGQYLFGDDLLVAPVTRPGDAQTGLAMVTVWIPPGGWTNWYTGRRYEGPAEINLAVPLDEVPLFVRDGGIIPTAPVTRRLGTKPIETCIVNVYPGESGEFRLYDDDGISNGYASDVCAWTTIASRRAADTTTVTIGAVEGEFARMPLERDYEIRIYAATPAVTARLNGNPIEFHNGIGLSYDANALAVVLRTPKLAVDKEITIEIEHLRNDALTAVLSKGLRGRLNLIAEVFRALGDDAPAIWRDANALRASLTEAATDSSSAAIDRSLLAATNTGELYRSLCSNEAVHPKRAMWLSELLGLYRDVTLVPSESAAGRAILRADIVATDAWSDRVRTRLNVSPPAGWSIAPDTEGAAPSEGGAKMSARIPIVAEGDLGSQPAILRATAEITLDGQTTRFETRQTILPSINAWRILGPFSGDPGKALDKVYPPEDALASPPDFAATYVGKGGQSIGWRKIRREVRPGGDLTAEFFIDFDDVFGGRVYEAVAYAFTFIDAPAEMDAVLAMGSDDGIVVWLNGEEVHRNNVGRPYSSKQDRANVRLMKGENTLLLKISQGGGDWGFGVHVEDAEGNPAPGVSTRIDAKSTSEKRREE